MDVMCGSFCRGRFLACASLVNKLYAVSIAITRLPFRTNWALLRFFLCVKRASCLLAFPWQYCTVTATCLYPAVNMRLPQPPAC